jgi:hypothetical protein
MPPETPTLLVYWESVIDDLMARTARFPRTLRVSLAGRIDNLALDVLEAIIEARFVRDARAKHLARANLAVEKLRVLLRVAHTRRALDTKSLEHLARRLDEAGRMVGGWLRQHKGTP